MKVKVLIIGAGPYGISLFNELTRQNISCLMVGIPFSLWMHHMIPRLNLRSNILASEIYSIDKRFSWQNYFKSLELDLNIDKRMRIPVAWFQNYARWVWDQLPEKKIEEKIIHLEDNQNTFFATTQSGINIEAEKVVIATGVGNHLFIPPSLQILSKERVAHSYHTKQYENNKNNKILVIGAGQSAADTLIALSPINNMTWVHRKPVIYYHEPLNIPQSIFNIIHHLTPVFYYFPRTINKLFGYKFTAPTIDPIVKDKINTSHVQEFNLSIEDLKLEEVNGEIISHTLDQSFHQIISCTGFHFQLGNYKFLDPGIKNKILVNKRNVPILNWQFETSVPGLFMIGGIAEFSHGPAARFMMGCRQTTLNVSRALLPC